MRARRLTAIAALIAATSVLAACGGGNTGNTGNAGSAATSDTAGTDTTDSTAGAIPLPRIATVVSYPALPSGLELGLFDDGFGGDASGIKIDYVASGTDGAAALAAGHADIVIGGFDPAALVADPNSRIVALSETSPRTHALLVKPGSEVTSIEDLEGATVGGFSATLSPFLAMLLDENDLPADYINYIQVPSDGGMAALTSGAIGAWYAWDPYYAQAEIEGLSQVVVDGEDFFLNPIVVLTSESFLKEQPESVEAFLIGYDQATDWVNQNPGEAAQYMSEATGMSLEAAEITISRRNYELTEPSESDIAWMNRMAETLVAMGSMTTVPDLAVAIDTTPLQAARAR